MQPSDQTSPALAFLVKMGEKKFDTCMVQRYVLHVRAAVLMFTDQSWKR